MIRAAALLLAACASPTADAPATFNDLAFSAQVPQEVVDAAAAELADCTGATPALDGWTVWIVADVVPTLSGGEAFVCPLTSTPECGPPPPGYTDETAPCRCSGVVDYASKRIAVTPSLASLTHELIHVGYSVWSEDAANAIERLCTGRNVECGVGP